MNEEPASATSLKFVPRGTLAEWKAQFRTYRRKTMSDALSEWFGLAIATGLLAWWYNSTDSGWGILPGLFLIPFGVGLFWTTIGLFFGVFLIPFWRVKVVRIQNVFLPMLPDDDTFFYFADHGIPALVRMEKVNLRDLATKWAKFKVYAICSRCGAQWPEPSDQCPGQCGSWDRALYWCQQDDAADSQRAPAA